MPSGFINPDPLFKKYLIDKFEGKTNLSFEKWKRLKYPKYKKLNEFTKE